MWRNYGLNYSPGLGLFGIISSVLFWIVIVLFIFALIRYLSNSSQDENVPLHPPPSPKGEPPMEILKRRYAQGEINKKEFEEMKKDLV